jgi:Peptidase_C39 like family
MSFPIFLGPLVPLPKASKSNLTHSYIVQPVGGAPASNSLPFSMQTQQGNFWCWAATSSSVSHFFNQNSAWTQCNIASTCLNSECCTTLAPCDKPYTLDGPLTQTGNLRGSAVSGNDTFAGVKAEIDQGRPVCCHISWSGGGGHFVAISGYDDSNQDLFVEDPLYGKRPEPYATFVNSYRGSGTWDYTYYTQP